MITIDPELEITLNALAEQEHVSPNEMIKKLISDHMMQKHAKENPNSFMMMINSIEPVQTLYSSEEMVAMLREGKEQFLTEAQNNYAK
jgi:hypothetical protein